MTKIEYDIDYLRARIETEMSDHLDGHEAKALLALYDAKCKELNEARAEIKSLQSNAP